MNLTTTKLTRKQVYYRIKAMPPGPEKVAATNYAVKKWGQGFLKNSGRKRFKPFTYDPPGYISNFLKWQPWDGIDNEHPGQIQILNACARVMQQQEEKDQFEKRLIEAKDLKVWSPDKNNPNNVIKNWIRVESGNGIGKTKSSSGILNWFLDCFAPSAIFTYAPGGDQARFVMWSEIGGDRTGKGLPGRILETEIKISKRHFAAHRTISVGGGLAEERAKGKHEKYQLFVLDEADGIDEQIFNSIVSQTSGGKNLVIMFANPRSRASMFHRIKSRSYVQTFRISTLYHPNVVAGYEKIPNAVKRDFVEKKIENDCEILHVHEDKNCRCRYQLCKCYKQDGLKCDEIHKKTHNEDDFTFDLPYSVTIGSVEYPSGTIFKPNARFMTDILGITPPNSTDNTLIPVGRYEAACKRRPVGGEVTKARVGIDCARFGKDLGTIYIRWQDAVWRAAELFKQDGDAYFHIIKPELLKLKDKGVTNVQVRIDAAYGSEVIGKLQKDDELIKAFKEYDIFEVSFNSVPYNKKEYYDLVTEMYAETAESLKSLCILGAPEKLEIDLCDRKYLYRNKAGIEVKKLEPKPDFKKRKKHSPDDGDGFVLAVAPDYCFSKLTVSISTPGQNQPKINKSSSMDTLLNILKKKQ